MGFLIATGVWTVAVLVGLRAHVAPFLHRLLFHWLPVIWFAGFVACIAGAVGAGYGVPSLFREDPELAKRTALAHLNSPVIWSVFAGTLFAAQLFSIAFFHEDVTGTRRARTFATPQRAVLGQAAALAGYLVVAVAFPINPISDHRAQLIGLGHELGEALAGLVAAMAVYAFAMWLGFVGMGKVREHAPELSSLNRFGERSAALIERVLVAGVPESGPRSVMIHRTIAFVMGSFAVIVLFVLIWPVLVPAASIAFLMGLALLSYFVLLILKAHARLVVLAVAVGLLGLANNTHHPYKQAFPGIDYPPDEQPKASRPELLRPEVALAAWKAQLHQAKPKLVVLATSGGAYRAGFLTAVFLDKLTKTPCAPLIRLVTGASGGMVAGAYYTALYKGDQTPSIEEAILTDVAAARDRRQSNKGAFKTWYPIARDSLSPVAQQMVTRDIPSLLLPFGWGGDRGIVLENEWLKLGCSISSLAEREAAGTRPSIVLSPMIVETGDPLFITNLDLSDLQRPPVRELFRERPYAATHLSLATAVRMNASFPYVSPAVSLPGKEGKPERLVDAGYFDNYGIVSALAILSSQNVRSWLRTETSGVIIVQVRASVPTSDPLPKTFQFLTSPIEGMGAARDSSMLVRGDAEIKELVADFQDNAAADHVAVDTVVFELSEKASVSWYLTPEDLESIHKGIENDGKNANELKRLEALCALSK